MWCKVQTDVLSSRGVILNEKCGGRACNPCYVCYATYDMTGVTDFIAFEGFTIIVHSHLQKCSNTFPFIAQKESQYSA